MSLIFSLWTVLVAIIFFGIVIWVFRVDKKEFDEAAQIPFEEKEEIPLSEISEEKKHG